jgi:WD40 repeat protein
MAITKELTAGQLSKLQSLLHAEGAITPDMFITALQAVAGAKNVDCTMARLLFNLVDQDDSGEITWREFQDHVLALRREEATEAQLGLGKECVSTGKPIVSAGVSKHVLHSGAIIRTMQIPTGQLITASLDGSVRRWNADTLEPEGVIHYASHGSVDAYLDPDSQLLLVANCDKSLSLYELGNGSSTADADDDATESSSSGPNTGSNNTGGAAVASFSRLLRSFALGRPGIGETELYRQQLRVPQPTPTFTFHGRIAPELEGSVLKRVWEAANSKLLQRVWAHRQAFDSIRATALPLTAVEVSCVACTSTGNSRSAASMYLGLRNGHIDVYNARIDRSVTVDGEIEQRLDPVASWAAHRDEVTKLRVHRPLDVILSSGMDSDVHMSHLERGTILKTFRGSSVASLRSHSRGVRGFDISTTNPMLVGTFGLERFAILWDPQVGKPLHVLHGHTARIVDLKFSPQRDNMIFTYSDDLTLRVWDMRTLRCIQQIRDQPWDMVGKTSSIYYDSTRQRIITCSHRLYAKAAVSPEMRQERDAHSMPILGLSYCSSERTLLSIDETSMRMWNTENGMLTALRKKDGLRCAILDGSGFSILVDTGADEVQVVGSSSNDPQMIFNPTTYAPQSTASSRDSSKLSTVSAAHGGDPSTSVSSVDDVRFLYWDAGYWISITKRWLRFYACVSTDSKIVHFVVPRHQFSSTMISGKITATVLVDDKLLIGTSLGYLYSFPIGFLAHTEGTSAKFALMEGLFEMQVKLLFRREEEEKKKKQIQIPSAPPNHNAEPTFLPADVLYQSVLIGPLHLPVRSIVWRAGSNAAFRTQKIVLGSPSTLVSLATRGPKYAKNHADGAAISSGIETLPGDELANMDDIGDASLAMRSVDGIAGVAQHITCCASSGGIFSIWNIRERCELFRWQGSILPGRVSITSIEGNNSKISPTVYFGDDAGYIGAFDFTLLVETLRQQQQQNQTESSYIGKIDDDGDAHETFTSQGDEVGPSFCRTLEDDVTDDLVVGRPAFTRALASRYATLIRRTCMLRVDLGAINVIKCMDTNTLCVGTATAELIVVRPDSGSLLRRFGAPGSGAPPTALSLPNTEICTIILNMHRMETIAATVEQTPRTEEEIVRFVTSRFPVLFPSESVALSVLRSMSPPNPELFLERLLEKSYQGFYQCLKEKQRSVKICGSGIQTEFEAPSEGDTEGEPAAEKNETIISTNREETKKEIEQKREQAEVLASSGSNRRTSPTPVSRSEQPSSPPNSHGSPAAVASPTVKRFLGSFSRQRASEKRQAPPAVATAAQPPAGPKQQRQSSDDATDELLRTWTATERALDAPMAPKPFSRTLASHQQLLATLEQDLLRQGGGPRGSTVIGADPSESLSVQIGDRSDSSTTAQALEASLRRRKSITREQAPPITMFANRRRSEFLFTNQQQGNGGAAGSAGSDGSPTLARKSSSRASFAAPGHQSLSMSKDCSWASPEFDYIPFPPLAPPSLRHSLSRVRSAASLSRQSSITDGSMTLAPCPSLGVGTTGLGHTTHQQESMFREELRARDGFEHAWGHGYDQLVVSCILDRIWLCMWSDMMWEREDIDMEHRDGVQLIAAVVDPALTALRAVQTFEQQQWNWLSGELMGRLRVISVKLVRPRLISYHFAGHSSLQKPPGASSNKKTSLGGAATAGRSATAIAVAPGPAAPFTVGPAVQRGSSYPRRLRRTKCGRRRHSADLLSVSSPFSAPASEVGSFGRYAHSPLAEEAHEGGRHDGVGDDLQSRAMDAAEKLFWARAVAPMTPAYPPQHELWWAAEWSRALDTLVSTEKSSRRKQHILRGLSMSFAARAKAFVQSIVQNWTPGVASAAHYIWRSSDGVQAQLVTNPVSKAATNNNMTLARKCASHEKKSIECFLGAQWDNPVHCHAPLTCVVQFSCLTFFCSCALPISEAEDQCRVQDAAPVAATMLRQIFDSLNLEPPVSRLSIPTTFRLFLPPNGVHWALGLRRMFPVEGPRAGDPEVAVALLRPELVQSISGSLCCSAFDPVTPIAVRKRSDRDVIKAGRKIVYTQVGELSAFLASDAIMGKVPYMDGAVVGHLHRFGVNLRYLAQVAYTLIRIATKDVGGIAAASTPTSGAGKKSSAGRPSTGGGGGGGGAAKWRAAGPSSRVGGSSAILRPWASGEAAPNAPRQLLIMKVVTAIFDEIVARAFRALAQIETEAIFFPKSTRGKGGALAAPTSSSVAMKLSPGGATEESPAAVTEKLKTKYTELLQLLLGISDGSLQFWSDRLTPLILSRFPAGDFADRIGPEDLDNKHLLRRIAELCAVEIDAKTGAVLSVGLRVKPMLVTPSPRKREDLDRLAAQLQGVRDATSAVSQQLNSIRTLMGPGSLIQPQQVEEGKAPQQSRVSDSTCSKESKEIMMADLNGCCSPSQPGAVAGYLRGLRKEEAWLLRHLVRIAASTSREERVVPLQLRFVAQVMDALFRKTTRAPLSSALGPSGSCGSQTNSAATDLILAECVCALHGARYDDALQAVELLQQSSAGSALASPVLTSTHVWASLLAVEINIAAGRHAAAIKMCSVLLDASRKYISASVSATSNAPTCEGGDGSLLDARWLEVADSLQIVSELYAGTSASIAFQRQARDILLERYKMIRKVLPPQDPLTMAAIADLALSHIRMEEEQEAIGLYDKLLTCGEKWIGPNSLFVLEILGKLGNACVSLRNFPAAEAVFSRVLMLCDSHYAQDLPVKVRAHLNTCEMHLAKGNGAQAVHEMKLARSIALGLPFNDPVLLALLMLEARMHVMEGAFSMALAAWTKILDARERTFGPLDASSADAMFELAVIMFRQRKFHEAWHVLDVCLNIRRQIYSSAHPVVAFTMAWLARTEAAAGNIVEAIEQFEQSAALFDAMVPVTDAMNVTFPKMRAQCLLDVASLLLHDVRVAAHAADRHAKRPGSEAGPNASSVNASASSSAPLDIKHNLAMGSDPQRVLQRAMAYLRGAHAITLAQFNDTRHPSLTTIQSLLSEAEALSERLRTAELGAVTLQVQSKLLEEWAKIRENAEMGEKSKKQSQWCQNAHKIYKLQVEGSSVPH